MSPILVEIIRAVVYILFTIIILAVFLYTYRQFFKKLLISLVSRVIDAVKKVHTKELETLKSNFKQLLDEKKNKLDKDIDKIKTGLSVESETYKLAAQKKFDHLISLFECSETLFEDTDFSDKEAVKAALGRIDDIILSINKDAVLFSPSTSNNLRTYLSSMAQILTNSETDYKINTVKTEKIAHFLDRLVSLTNIFSPKLNLVKSLGDEIVLSNSKKLKASRRKAAIDARINLENALRTEFGTWTPKKQGLQ